MKQLLMLSLALLAAASGASAVSNGRDGSGGFGPIGIGSFDLRDGSDVLIYQDRGANEGFLDLIPAYAEALSAAGAVISAIDAPPEGNAFPSNFSPANYPVTFIVTGENWWGSNFDAGEAATIASYLDAGGAVYFCGQDYLMGAGYSDGVMGGFPAILGIASAFQDIPDGADAIEVRGRGLFEGRAVEVYRCFLNNKLYPDALYPRSGAEALWEMESPDQHAVALAMETSVFRVIVTTVEFACASESFREIVERSYTWLRGGVPPVPVQSTTWGELKAIYR